MTSSLRSTRLLRWCLVLCAASAPTEVAQAHPSQGTASPAAPPSITSRVTDLTRIEGFMHCTGTPARGGLIEIFALRHRAAVCGVAVRRRRFECSRSGSRAARSCRYRRVRAGRTKKVLLVAQQLLAIVRRPRTRTNVARSHDSFASLGLCGVSRVEAVEGEGRVLWTPPPFLLGVPTASADELNA